MDTKTLPQLLNSEFPHPQDTPFVFVLSGHAGAGKSALTERLLMSTPEVGVPMAPFKNYKNRRPRPSEVEGMSYHFVSDDESWEKLRQSGKISPVEFAAHSVRYGFSSEFIDALKGTTQFPIVNVNLQGLSRLRQYISEANLQNRIISIGLYCDMAEAKNRILSRERLTPEHVEPINDRIEHLPIERESYRRYASSLRYLFYNPSHEGTLDHIVDRTLDLFRRENQYAGLNDETFRRTYLEDCVNHLFNRDSEKISADAASGTPVYLKFSDDTLRRYEQQHGRNLLDDIDRDSTSKVAGVVRAYGVLTVLLDETETALTLNADGQQRRREILQELLRIQLGIPQSEQKGPIIKSPVTTRGLLCAQRADFSHVSAYSAYDIFPLMITQQCDYLPPVNSAPHALNIELVYRNNGSPGIEPLPRKEIFGRFNPG